MSKSILLVEDEELLRETLAELLTQEGYAVTQASEGHAGRDAALEQTFDLVITDIRMPGMDGLELLGHLQQICPQTPVVVLTAFGTVESSVHAMRHGAVDYLLKPVQFEDMLSRVARALEVGRVRSDRRALSEHLEAESSFHDLIGQTEQMRALFETVRKLSAVRSSVLIAGESGTGKELFARAIHFNGVTKGKPFVAVNCGAIPDSLIESELFGHRKGAFTGAVADRIGYFEAAQGGTLFLDEISTLPLPVQSSLLRVLEERTVTPVGDTRARPVDLRIIAATNQDLRELHLRGEFREDLIYRVDVVRLEIPPLRERRQDIPVLAHHFLHRFCKKMDRDVPGFTNTAMRAMLAHPWPGNVRELENVMERAVIFADDREIDAGDLAFSCGRATHEEYCEDLKRATNDYERQHIIESLRRHEYDKSLTAKCLGIGVSSLYRKMDELDIPKDLEKRDAEGLSA